MLLGEPGRRYAPDAAVRPDLVVIGAPGANRWTCLLQRLEPVIVQALVPELAVEALDVAVLHRPPRLDQDVAHTVALRPGHERSAGELRPVVGSHRALIALEEGGSVQQPRDVLAADAEVHRDVHAVADVYAAREPSIHSFRPGGSVCPAIGEGVDLGRIYPVRFQEGPHRSFRPFARCVSATTDSLLFERADELPVNDEAGRRVMHKGHVRSANQSDDDHAEPPSATLGGRPTIEGGASPSASRVEPLRIALCGRSGWVAPAGRHAS